MNLFLPKFKGKVMRDWRVLKSGDSWDKMRIVHADCMEDALRKAVSGDSRPATEAEINNTDIEETTHEETI